MIQEKSGQQRIIDIGCGSPQQKYFHSYGIDINPKCKPDLVWDVDDGLPFNDDSVMIINSDNSLEHVKNPRYVLEEMFRVLWPGGTVYLSVPNSQYLPLSIINHFVDLDWFWHWYMTRSFKKERGVHWTLYTKHLIIKTCKDVGFTIQETKGNLWSKEVRLILTKIHTRT